MTPGVCIDCDAPLSLAEHFGRCLRCRIATLPDELRAVVNETPAITEEAA